MKPDLDFAVLHWHDSVHVLSVRVFGTDHRGKAVTKDVKFTQPVAIGDVSRLVAKMNNGQYRPA